MAVIPTVAIAATNVRVDPTAEPEVVVDPVDIELDEFAEREAASPDLVDFVGGNPIVIVIGTGTLLIIVVVVLVVLILR